jgi:3-hydroxyacyl-CoA dehydrogenase
VSELKPKQYIGYAMRQLAQVPGIDPEMTGRDIKQVAVIGAGLMGSGIAVCFLRAGIPTILVDQSEEALEKGRKSIAKMLGSGVKKGMLTPDQSKGIQLLVSTTLDYNDLKECDLIIEAVFERMDIKQAIFKQLGEIAKDGALLATNTSGLDVDQIAAASGRPGDVVGLHFFSPAFVMPLLEIVRGKETTAEALKTALYVSTITYKTGVVVGNCFGFAANRMLEGYARESEFLLLEGATPEEIDQAMVNYGFPMGPCTMGDMAGVDVRNYVLDGMKSAGLIPDDPRYGAVSKALFAEGRLGQKTGAGNYDYGEDGRTPIPSARVAEIQNKIASKLGVKQRTFSENEIVNRLMLPVINEAAKIVEEGIVNHPSDIDILWIYGYGFPMAKGGPVYQSNQMGLEQVRAALNAYQDADEEYGEIYWSPAPSLEVLFK